MILWACPHCFRIAWKWEQPAVAYIPILHRELLFINYLYNGPLGVSLPAFVLVPALLDFPSWSTARCFCDQIVLWLTCPPSMKHPDTKTWRGIIRFLAFLIIIAICASDKIVTACSLAFRLLFIWIGPIHSFFQWWPEAFDATFWKSSGKHEHIPPFPFFGEKKIQTLTQIPFCLWNV